MSVFNEKNKFKKEKLCKRKRDFYINNKITLISSIRLSKVRS